MVREQLSPGSLVGKRGSLGITSLERDDPRLGRPLEGRLGRKVSCGYEGRGQREDDHLGILL